MQMGKESAIVEENSRESKPKTKTSRKIELQK
jgi:hypothetical protein